jgi:hypothetical protein
MLCDGDALQCAGSECSMMADRVRRIGAAVGCAVFLSAMVILMGPPSGAGPGDPPSPPDPPSNSDLIRAFPVITPTPSAWAPMFPFPYDQTKNRVTGADVTAMREMCQWYNAQYATLSAQIDRLQYNRIDKVPASDPFGPNGKDYDYTRDDIQQQVDIVSRNVGQAVDFLTPRAQSLTQAQNPYGDNYFPIYKGEQFYKLWEQLSNVNNGILAHQAGWFTGPSVQKAKRWGTDIHRSHVCD